MNKRDAYNLLVPAGLFLLVAVGTLGVADILRDRVDATVSRETIETFVGNVQSGDWNLTTDKWLEVVRRFHASEEADREMDESLRRFVLSITLAATFGLIWQGGAVLYIRKRLTEGESEPGTGGNSDEQHREQVR